MGADICTVLRCGNTSSRRNRVSGQVRIMKHSRFARGRPSASKCAAHILGRVRASSVTCGQLGAGVDPVMSFSHVV